MAAPLDVSPRRWRAGVLLLVASWPIGALGVLLAGLLATSLHSPRWLVVGATVYGLSWVMVGLGMWLAGWEGMRQAQSLWRGWLRRRR